MKFAAKIPALLLALSLCVPVAQAANDAAEWIQRMSRAMEEMTYEGTFVYMHNGEVEAMHVVHEFDQHGVRERLSSLNGEARVIIRDSDHVTCIWPGSKSVIVSKSQPRTPFPQFATDANPAFMQYYQFMISGEDRVAGRDSMVVAMMPRDNYRYGYKLWVDKESSVLLRAKLLDSQERVIEQVMFTDITFPERARVGSFQVSHIGDDFEWRRTPVDGKPVDDARGRINFRSLPEGFSKISEAMRPMPMNANPVRHAIVSDGVASVSIYVEHTGGETASGDMEGASAMGAVHAYSKKMDQVFVTVVGEVPLETVRRVADGVVVR